MVGGEVLGLNYTLSLLRFKTFMSRYGKFVLLKLEQVGKNV